jgi:hypothetical protein
MLRSIAFIAVLFALPWVSGCGNPAQPDPLAADVSNVRQVVSESLPVAPGLEGKKTFAPLADVVAAVDPRRDKGWETEAISEASLAQLKKLGKLLAHPDQRQPADLESFVTEEFQSESLRPKTKEVFRDHAYSVLRWQKSGDGGGSSAPARGREALAAALEALATAHGDPEKAQVRTEFKMVSVEVEAGTGEAIGARAGTGIASGTHVDGGSGTRVGGTRARTTVYFQAAGAASNGAGPQGIVQQTGTWICGWQLGDEGVTPKLTSIEVQNYEEIRPVSAQRTFAECTEAVLGGNESYTRQLAYGADHWFNNLEVGFGVHQGNQGLAIGDVNGDDLDDVYICQPAGLPNRLFVQQNDGTLKDISAQSGADWLDMSRSALLVDLDNDRDQDLVVALRWSMIVHENMGAGRFEVRRMVDTNANLMSLSAADYDQDGDLDLYVCGYTPGPDAGATDIFANPVPYHDANNGAKNFLLRNEGGLDFVDVTAEVGLEQNNRKFSFAAAWEDYDNDGDLDLYVANDFGRKNLYRNDGVGKSTGGRFRDVAAEAGVEDIGAGMSVSFGDYDRDGRMDLYVGNMFSSAGNRIAFQSGFNPTADDATRGQLQRHARGNSLFRNLGDGRFADVSVAAGVTMGRWAWGSLFTDINNDGWEDLHVVNGFFTNEDPGDL